MPRADILLSHCLSVTSGMTWLRENASDLQEEISGCIVRYDLLASPCVQRYCCYFPYLRNRGCMFCFVRV